VQPIMVVYFEGEIHRWVTEQQGRQVLWVLAHAGKMMSVPLHLLYYWLPACLQLELLSQHHS
jgi:hypothetical protein